jgi:hypothetical protein
MSNLLNSISLASTSLSKGATQLTTAANVVTAVGIVGQTAASLSSDQTILTALFGSAKGAIISLVALLVSHAASKIAAYGAPAGGATSPSAVSLNVTAPAAPQAPSNVTEETLTTKTTTPVS